MFDNGDRLYWNDKTGKYQTEFPNKEDRIVYLMGDEGLTLSEALATKKALEEHIDARVDAGIKRGIRPVRKALDKLNESIYYSQRY